MKKMESKKLNAVIAKAVIVPAVISMLISNIGMACDLHGETGFLPENKMNIPVGLKSAGGITEIQFNKVLDKVSSLYSNYVSSKSSGRKLVIERRWTDGTVNAYAHQNTTGVNTIVMFGGLARHAEVTADAMALVACHELGHHMGGAPVKPDPSTGSISWASNEGQADYWGTMKCLRHYFENEDNATIVKSMSVPSTVTNSCELVYKNANEIAICERSAMAGLAVGKLFNNLMKDKVAVNFSTPDKRVVQVTFDNHPMSQCRLDTYVSGALCDRDISFDVSKTDANQGVCSLANGDRLGNRPLCWFKP